MEASVPGGKIILVSGPSGSGKHSLISYIRELYPDLKVSVSCTTRAMRPGESDGVEYYFLSVEKFKRRIEMGEFLEWAEYSGNYYGTPKGPVMEMVDAGHFILLEIEIQGVQQIQKMVPPEKLVTIYIDAGSWEDLVERIQSRAPMSPEDIEKRKARFDVEIRYKEVAMYVIHNANGRLEEAKKEMADLILSITNQGR
jgi:guanylate kinase